MDTGVDDIDSSCYVQKQGASRQEASVHVRSPKRTCTPWGCVSVCSTPLSSRRLSAVDLDEIRTDLSC